MQTIEAACEQVLSPSQAAELSNFKSTKQKIEYIASFLKLWNGGKIHRSTGLKLSVMEQLEKR